VTGVGLPVVVKLTAGQEADVSSARDPLAGVPHGAEVGAVIADKGYDSKAVVEAARAMGAEAVIPALSTRKEQRQIDAQLDKERDRADIKGVEALDAVWAEVAVARLAGRSVGAAAGRKVFPHDFLIGAAHQFELAQVIQGLEYPVLVSRPRVCLGRWVSGRGPVSSIPTCGVRDSGRVH
jgi:hypothetical protein